MFSTFISVALGGAVGACLRFAVGLWVAFPMGTLAVNVAGSFAIGVVWLALDKAWLPFVMTGVLGGFTTFSAFSLDTLRLMEEGRILYAGAYVGASVLLSLLACGVGLTLARSLS
jgi:CrcB protein